MDKGGRILIPPGAAVFPASFFLAEK